jgi:hypothetical protein
MMTELPPVLFPGPWKDLQGADARLLRQRYFDSLKMSFLRQFNRGVFKAAGVLRARPLACYPRHLLCEIGLQIEGEVMASAFLFGAEGVIVLEGSSAPIHKLNRRIGLAIETPEAAQDYAMLFCNAVHGEEGRFHMIQSLGELAPYCKGDLAPLEAMFAPVEVQADGENWRVRGLVRYGRGLFRSEFRLERDGGIEMVEDELLLPELACGPDRFVHMSRGAPICAEES